MGEYHVSRENYEGFVQSVILKRLEEDVVWGLNAQAPHDVMTFTEECFTEGIDDEEIKKLIGDYLFQNGFRKISAGKPNNLITCFCGHFRKVYAIV